MIASISDRVMECTVLPVDVFKSSWEVIQTIVGIAATAFSVATLGNFQSFNLKSNLTEHSSTIITRLYARSLKILNPKANYMHVQGNCLLSKDLVLPLHCIGITSSKNKESFYIRQIDSRIAFGLSVIVETVTAPADFALGCLAAAMSYATLGRVAWINSFALDQLSSTGAIGNISNNLRGLVNPLQQYL